MGHRRRQRRGGALPAKNFSGRSIMPYVGAWRAAGKRGVQREPETCLASRTLGLSAPPVDRPPLQQGPIPHAERCRSGRSGRSRKPLSPQGFRGFESLPLRQFSTASFHGTRCWRTSSMSRNRDAYLEATGLARKPAEAGEPGQCGEEADDVRLEARRAALARSHEIRQFEIELYWKRANYFWLLQAAVFAAVGLTWKNTASGVPPVIPVLLSALEVVTASAGYLSALGSKFWQVNWEHRSRHARRRVRRPTAQDRLCRTPRNSMVRLRPQ